MRGHKVSERGRDDLRNILSGIHEVKEFRVSVNDFISELEYYQKTIYKRGSWLDLLKLIESELEIR